MKKPEPRFPNKLLISGMALVLAGSVFLLWTLKLFPEFLLWLIALWPVPLLLAGLVMLYLVYLKGKSHQLLLPGMILLLCGVFFLLYNTVIPEKSFEHIWPAFITIAGLALLPYGLKSPKKARVGILISAATLAVLSVLFFPFSLDLVEVDFIHFSIRWWPGIIVITGVILIISFFINKNRRTVRAKARKMAPPSTGAPSTKTAPTTTPSASSTPPQKTPAPRPARKTTSPGRSPKSSPSTKAGKKRTPPKKAGGQDKNRRTDLTRA